jgi:thiol-disulfide isomerase/thioredoxin
MEAQQLWKPVQARTVWTLAALAVLVATVGCGQGSKKLPTASVSGGSETPASPAASQKVDPAELLQQMVAVYREAPAYEDAGELVIAAESNGEKQRSPVIPFSVAFERPNKIRVHSLEASIVANGEKLQASADSLAGQVLTLPCPEKITAQNLESDALLVQAMRGQIDVAMPQLALLVDEDPIRKIAGDGAPTAMPDAELNGEMVHRVAIEGQSGTSVFWISPKSKLLVQYEFPTKAFQEKHSLASASITLELKGAKVEPQIAAEAFKFDVPEGAKLLSRFLPPPPEPPSPILGQKPAGFTFVKLDGGSVTPESLEGKVVVLDMWATWCGWCFEGFPNLQKVYDQFKDNDKVVILAVNTEDVTVSDEKVQAAFEKAKLTIPIVRDGKKAADEIFQVQGLPTMVILGADGAVEDYHIGYDANLAETLPKKIDRLLSGESLAKEELDKFKGQLEEYKKKEADALVADAVQAIE